jgi:hypothetical protein
MSKEFLYRRMGFAVIVLSALLWAPAQMAGQMPQLKRPGQEPEKLPEAKKPKKKVKGPRAIGLLQLNSAGKATLIPIAILVEGKFYDASSYKADPIPMALETGTVYEVEQTGESQGLFTVNGALHSKVEETVRPWAGSGAFLPRGTELAKTTRKAENVPVGLDISDSDAPPRLTRGDSAKKEGGQGTAAPGAPVGTPSATGGAKQTESKADGESTGKANAGNDSAKAASSSPSPVPDKSGASAGTIQGSNNEGANGQGSTNQKAEEKPTPGGEAEGYYRPRLRRGKPTESAPPDELASVTSKPASGGTDSAAIAGPLRLLPAISDEGGPDPRTYKFFWKTGEEDERRTQMLALAGEAITAYAKALAKNTIPASTPAVKAGANKKKTAVKPALPTFENTEFQAFDVWGNNQAVMILSTEAHFAPIPGDAKAPETYSVTILARTDIYGNLRKIYSGVTDRFHLDVTPKLELVDAVDADGDGRGELLFRETSDAGSGYVIYRATADKLWKMFDSLAEK